MSRKIVSPIVLMIFMLSIVISACAPLLEPVRSEGQALPPVERQDGPAIDDPNVFVDFEPFQAALLQAIQARDEEKLRRLMAESFVSGQWRGEMGEQPQATALRDLYNDQLGENIQLQVAPKVDLPALMGGINPLDIPRPETNVVSAVVVTGWGKLGQDEAILYVSRQPDNSLRWAGTLMIKGGFTSSEAGGVQPLVNNAHGYQLYLPAGYEVEQPSPDEIIILAPRGTQGHRERAILSVEPANGRSAEQVAAQIKADLPAPFSEQNTIVVGLDTELAVVLDRVPSQDMQRVLLVVHNSTLYRMIFVPHDEQEGEAYNQMKNLYAMVANTFMFLPASAEGGDRPASDLSNYLHLLRAALAKHDKPALQTMIGEPFTLAFWRSEGMQISQAEAFQQILNNYAPAGAQLTLDPHHPLVAQLFPEPIKTEAGEELIPVYVSGWGLEGKDEAIFLIARKAGGSFYWQGVMTALGGFE